VYFDTYNKPIGSEKLFDKIFVYEKNRSANKKSSGLVRFYCNSIIGLRVYSSRPMEGYKCETPVAIV
jgi:hypothetical protein